jgi:hypothetical protein
LLTVIESGFDDEGYPADEVHGFFRASSEFYPHLDDAVHQRVDAWLRRAHRKARR